MIYFTFDEKIRRPGDMPRATLIGDSLLPEPAMSAFAEFLNQPVGFIVSSLATPLYAEHPWIRTFATFPPDATHSERILLSDTQAFQFAVADHTPFSRAFYRFLPTLPPARLRRDYFWNPALVAAIDGLVSEETREIAAREPIVVFPFAHACDGQGVRLSNKTADPAYWDDACDAITRETGKECLTSGLTIHRYIKNCKFNLRNWPVIDTFYLMIKSPLVIGVNSGLPFVAAPAHARNLILLEAAVPPWFSLMVAPWSAYTMYYSPKGPSFWPPADVLARKCSQRLATRVENQVIEI